MDHTITRGDYALDPADIRSVTRDARWVHERPVNVGPLRARNRRRDALTVRIRIR